MSRKRTAISTSELRNTIHALVQEATANPPSAKRRRALEEEINELTAELGRLLRQLDPIAEPEVVFDPSNPKLVGRFIALGLVAQPRCNLGSVPNFYGSGIYALYYNGSFRAYRPISGTETPIYVGTTTPAVPNARTPYEQGTKLVGRIARHAKNIAKATSTLALADFEVRSLVVHSGWEKQAESYLISLFRPAWNKETQIISGFGKHGDSPEMRGHGRSPWDTLHPARAWAGKSATDQKPESKIVAELSQHFAAHPPYASVQDVLAEFFDELRRTI
jgi:hypothetical protein